MDNKGLNVGQSDLTSDYFQGDESKWKNSFLKGTDAVEIGDIEFDDSSNAYQVQVSIPVTENNKNIGAITVGINIDAFIE